MPNAFVSNIAQGQAAPDYSHYKLGANTFQNGANSLLGHMPAPISPALQQQQDFAKSFTANIPQMEQRMYGQLANQTNAQMNQGIQNVNQGNSNRGLLYGGINAGGEQGVRNQASNQLAAGRQSINQNVIGAANQITSEAVNTGVSMQQQQQVMQNAIYGQAMAQMNAQNQAFGGLLQAGGMISAAALL